MKRIKLAVFFFSISACILVDDVTALEPEGILGGDESPLGQYTYQLSLRIDGDDDCGAGILDENHVITGAHCVADRDDGFHDETLQIVGGTNDLNCDTSTRVTVDVETIYIPAAYMTTEHDADIAVLKLKQSLNLDSNPNLSKMNLPEHKTYDGEHAIINGFGWNTMDFKEDPETGEIEEDGADDGKMHFAETIIHSLAECRSKSRQMWISEKHLCASVIQRSPTEYRGVCAGDSGSPLVYEDNTIIGIASITQKSCSEKVFPSIYTRVSAYIDFIQKAIDGKCDSSIISKTVENC